MKKFLLFAFAVAAMVSCKKAPYEPTPVGDGEEIAISSSTKATKGVVTDYEKDARNNFFAGDQIGIFLANEDTDAALVGYDFTTEGARTDVGYEYGEPFWKKLNPTSANGRLLFPVATPAKAKLYAYFPYSGTVGSTVAVDATTAPAAPVVTFTLPVDQSTDVTLRVADLMYAKSEGKTAQEGWEKTSAAINLEFNHLLTKTAFAINLENKYVSPAATATRYIRAVEIKGANIVVAPATLTVESGVLTPNQVDANPALTGSVWYRNFSNVEAEACKIETADKKTTPGTVGDAGDPALIDLLLYPFTQAAHTNEFVIYLTADLTETITAETLATLVADGKVERYVVSVEKPTDVIEGTFADDTSTWYFKAGRANKFNLTIDPGKKSINITTSIVAWGGNVIHTPDVD